MINAPQIVRDTLTSGNFKYANLVTVNLGDAYGNGQDEYLYLTDCSHTVTFSGNAYITNHNLKGIDGISRKASTGSDSVDISFSVTDENLIQAIKSERYINKLTRIERVLIDTDGSVIGDFAIPVRSAWGISHSITGDLDDREIILTIDSALGDITGDNGWYAVDASHQRRHPNDRIMRHSNTVMTEEQNKKYTTNFKGIIDQEIKPPALPKIYGYKNVELVPIAMLKHRKTHTSYRHYFTTLIYVISIGEVDHIDINNLTKDGEQFDGKIVTDNRQDIGGWSARVMTPADAEVSDIRTRGNNELKFWFEQMDSDEKARMDGMWGKGLTLLFVKNRNRDDWLFAPPKFNVPVRGAKVYDPRTGTEVFSRNPALQYADYLRSSDYGANNRGISVSDANIVELANHFDVLPDSAGDGIDSILTDIQLDTGQSITDNMNIWIEGVRLYTSDYYGEFNIRVETKSPVTWSINENDLRDYPDYDSGEFTDRLNELTYTVKQLVPDTSEDAEVGDLVEVSVEATFPPEGGSIYNAWLAEDGGLPLFKTEQLNYVTVLEQAYYWAMVDARISRQPRTMSLVVGELGWLTEVGDIIEFTSDVMEMEDTLWRVEEVNEDDDIELTLKAYDITFYTPAPDVVPDPVGFAPAPASVELSAVTGLSIISNQNFYYLSWNPLETQNVLWYAVEIYKDGVLIVDNPRVAQPPLLLETIEIGSYEARVTAYGNDKEGDIATLTFDISEPSLPVFSITPDTFGAEVSLSTTSVQLGTIFELRLGTTNDVNASIGKGEGNSFTLVNLLPETTYHLFARTKNIVGVSDWATVTFTTLDGQKFTDVVAGLTPNLGGIEGDILDLNREVDDILESIIWTNANVQSQVTVDATEQQERVTEAKRLSSDVETESGRVDAVIVRVDQVETDSNGNAQAISILNGAVYNGTTGLNATYQLAQSAQSDADGNAQAINSLSNQVNNSETGLVATNTLAQSASVSAQNNAEAVTALQSNISAIVGISLADVTMTSGSNVVTVNSSENIAGYTDGDSFYINETGYSNEILTISSVNNNSREITLQNNAPFDAANVSAVIKSGTSTTAELQLAVTGNTNDINTLQSEYFLGGTVQGDGSIRVSGIKGSVNASIARLSFIGDLIDFLRQDGTRAIYFDTVNDNYILDGTVYAKNLIGEQASGAVTQLPVIALDGNYKEVVSFTVAAAEWQRVIIIPCPWFGVYSSNDNATNLSVQFKVNGGNLYTDGTVRGDWSSGKFSSSPQTFTMSPNTTYTFSIEVKVLSTDSGNLRANLFTQGYAPTVFKKSNEITFN